MFCYVSFEDSFIGQKISNDKGKLTACYNTKNTSLHKKKIIYFSIRYFPLITYLFNYLFYKLFRTK